MRTNLPASVIEKMTFQPEHTVSGSQISIYYGLAKEIGMGRALEVQQNVQPLIDCLNNESLVLNFDKWSTQGVQPWVDQRDEVLQDLQRTVPTLGMYSVRSNQQIVAHAHIMGIEIPSTGTTWLVKHRKDNPVIGLLLRKKNLDQLLKRFKDDLVPLQHDGHVMLSGTWDAYASYSGRMASHQMALTALPRGMRDYYDAPLVNGQPGAYVSFDENQIELRILAGASHCQLLLSQFAMGHDVHCYIAGQLFSVAEDSVTPRMRKVAKTLVYALVYGAGDQRLRKIVQKSGLTVVTSPKRLFQERYPEVMRLLSKLRASKVIYYALRPTTVPPRIGTEWLSSASRQNLPIQSAASLLLKQVMVRLTGETHIVNVIHDELICVCEFDQVDSLRQRVTQAYLDAADDLELALPMNNIISTTILGGNSNG